MIQAIRRWAHRYKIGRRKRRIERHRAFLKYYSLSTLSTDPAVIERYFYGDNVAYPDTDRPEITKHG